MPLLSRLFSAVCLVSAASFVSLRATAQSNYRPGYVVTSKGDTVKGFIDYQAWDNNPTAISFKSSLADRNKQTWSLSNARYFSINGLAAYKKFVVSISTDITNTMHLSEGRDTSFKIDTVFLKVLQKGRNIALYSFNDDSKNRFYIGDAPDYTPTELVLRVYYDPAKTEGRTVYENGYQKQLFSLATKYKVLDDKLTFRLEKADYESGDLLTIVSQINHISKGDFEKNYSSHSKVSFYAGASVVMTSTTSDTQSPYSMAGGIPHTSYLPGVAFGVDLVPDPNGGRVEFKLDLSLNPGKFDSKYTFNISPFGPAEASYNQLSVSVFPQVMYNLYNSTNFKFYIGAGFGVSYNSFSNPYFGNPDHVISNTFPIEGYYFQRINGLFMLKAGFRIAKKWEIYFDYYESGVTTPSPYFVLSNQTNAIGVNYYFGQ